MLLVRDLRRSFIDFFKERGHRIVPSSSLIPKDDPTLLFATAGMVQFKPMFAGTVDLPYTRAASVQKCFRTSDLERVGKTKRHLTFFEMLGNFSFGDYFKTDAIKFAWEYSTRVIGFPADKIWVSIYENDDEAHDIWHLEIGVPKERIVRLGKADNFWGPAGDSGACGPCSELYLDRGAAFGCSSPDCKPGCDCERFLEYWNLVFNQFNQDVGGKLSPLPRTGIDTGMGLERLATLVQNVDSVYDTDEVKGIVNFVCTAAGVRYEKNAIEPVNIIVEHARALCFAMTDGVYPSNDGRGYVLRRILRRAMRYTRQLGIKDPFVFTVIDPIVAAMGEFYPEIRENASGVKKIIESEERRFLDTLENGMDRLDEIIKNLKKSKESLISGIDAFILYDTFGFPVEMTCEIAQEQGLGVDVGAYEHEMNIQRERGKQSWKADSRDLESTLNLMVKEAGDTVFRGYDAPVVKGTVCCISDGSTLTDRLTAGSTGMVVLDSTSFYGESGGQVGDIGVITNTSGARFIVEDTKKHHKTIVHLGRLEAGELRVGTPVCAEIDVISRNLIRANHTGTHLLNAALRAVLGPHVKQAGSHVAPDRMRFDFSHFNAIGPEELEAIESRVNEKIWQNIAVATTVMKTDEAIKNGATAVFGEKYEDDVRVVIVDDFSKELCGGTHVTSTGEIGVFKILKESSPGAGMRRIEAVTLKGLLDRYKSHDRMIGALAESMNTVEADIVKKVDDLMRRHRALEKEMEKLKKESLSSGVGGLVDNATTVQGIRIISQVHDDASVADLRELSDAVRSREQNAVVLLGSRNNGSPVLLFAATANAVGKGIDCGKIVQESVKMIEGRGGGRKDMAQAGGKNQEQIDAAIAEAVAMAVKMLGN